MTEAPVSAGLLTLAFTCLMIIAATADEAAAGRTLDVGNDTQVFIDGRFLASADGAEIVACQPRKTYEKSLTSKSRFADGWLRGYETILPTASPWQDFHGYHALSKDGIHWRRVSPGTVPDDDDVIGLYNGKPYPFVDPNAPPEQRYKLFQAGRNMIKSSPHGVDWEIQHKGMFPEEAMWPGGMDSHNKCFYDTRLNKYVGWVRVNLPVGPVRIRTVGRAVTDDLSTFPMPEIVFRVDDRDPQFGRGPRADFYTPEVVQYPHADRAYFMFTARYLHYDDSWLPHDPEVFPESASNIGPIDIGFAASRDGIHWQRYDRRPWLPLGPDGSFDSKCMYMCSGMYTHGDKISMYYVGYPTLHGSPRPRSEWVPTMSRVVLLKNRFTAVEADYSGGEFTTPPLQFDGETLHLNIDTSALGLARVEIQDADGNNAIDGYALDNCDRIHSANTTDRVVTWNGGEADISQLAGQPVRVRFELKFGARMHAFRFGPL